MKTISLSCLRPIWDKHNCRLEDNLDSLKDAVNELKNKKESIRIRIKREASPYKERTYRVTDWLCKADRLETETDKVIAEGQEELLRREPRCCCANCFCNSNSEVGKRVWEKLNSVNQILIEGNFDFVVQIRPHDFVDLINVEATVDFESGLDDVWRCVEDDSFRIIGIYGMAGIGKTTLLKKIKDELLVRKQEFEKVIWVEVSREANVDAIQNVIRKQLSISNETWKKTNKRDMERLLGSKKFILLLDDLWDRLDLLKFGVPVSDGSGSKVIFTTRSERVCDEMKAQKKLKLKCLSREQALTLFRSKVGLNYSNFTDHVADTINTEFCQGLPLALISIAQAMSRMSNSEVEHRISTLQNYPSTFPGMNHIFRIIEPSFDSLEDDILKNCFIHTCILPNLIRKDEVIKLWIGEGILDMYAKNLGDYVIKRLKASCLLEGDESSDIFWMHSVIRTFGLWLAREHGEKENKVLVQERRVEKWTEAVRISIYDQKNVMLPLSPCPQVRTLLIRYTNLNAFPTGLQSMNALGVLDLSKNKNLSELPSGIGSLINLQYLNLSFTSIKELPVEMKNLANLRLLLMDYTENFQVIPKRLISSFSSLQVFNKLGDKIFEDTTLLEELESIEHLSDISISLFSYSAAERMLNSLQSCIRNLSLKHVEKLNIPISVLSRLVHLEELDIEGCEDLRFENDNTQYYVLNFQSLRIRGCSKIYDLRWLIFAPKIRTLDLRSCESLFEIVGNDFESEEIKEIDTRLGILPSLKKLYLEDLQHLHHICHQALQFPVLMDIVVIGCPNLVELPFHLHSATRLRDIKGAKSWWDRLKWEDVAIRDVFDYKFQDVFGASQFQQIHYSRTASPRMNRQQEGSTAGKLLSHADTAPSTTKGKGKRKLISKSPIAPKTIQDRRPSNPRGKRKWVFKSPLGIRSKAMLSNTKEESVIITKRLGSSWLKTFTYEELVEATANFSYGSLLGEGGSGKVYKGMLSNGEAVAVKHFKNDRETADNEFLAEIETISRIHHRNIVKLVGYCQNQANKLLVYEFVPNNSLRYHLFENDNLSIDWSIRMKIAVGSAKGLTYLHEECEPRIVHRNINPSNILLDHSFEPKISDFGLAIVFPDSVTEIYEKVMGTIGYLEPEYLQHGKITVKTDVFCYGVVLMELITGKRAVETMDDDLVLSVKSLLKESLETGNGYAFIDPKLGLSYDLDEMHRMIFCAAACVYKPAELRPQMSQIVSALKGNIPVVSIWRPGDNSFLYDRQRYESPARSTGSGTVGTGSGTVGTGAGSVDEIYEDEEYLR